MGDVIKIIKPLEDSGLLINGVYETIKNEAKEQKGRFGMLLGRLGISLLGYISRKRCIKSSQREQIELVRIFNAVLSFKKF